LQLIIVKYTLPYKSKEVNELNDKIKYNLENKDKLTKKFEKITRDIANKINSGEMEFKEWMIYVHNLPRFIEIDGIKYYWSVWEYLGGKNEEFIALHFSNEKYEGMSFSDIQESLAEYSLNTKHTTTENSNLYSYKISKINLGKDNMFEYYWIDPESLQSVMKMNINSYWKDKDSDKQGYVAIGIDLENLSDTYGYKYYKEIRPYTLLFVSIMTLIVAIIITNLNATKYSNIRGLIFLLVSNLYITLFINTYETESTLENEFLKLKRIVSSVLGLSFLSGVNIYILKSLYKNKTMFFKETSFIFGVSIIFLLITIYKYKTPEIMEDIIIKRITGQLTFNFSVLLNMLILVNFIVYTLSIKKTINV
jgi:hypothetical protein